MQFNDFFSPTFLVDHKQSNSKSKKAKLMKDKYIYIYIYIYKTRTRTLNETQLVELNFIVVNETK